MTGEIASTALAHRGAPVDLCTPQSRSFFTPGALKMRIQALVVVASSMLLACGDTGEGVKVGGSGTGGGTGAGTGAGTGGAGAGSGAGTAGGIAGPTCFDVDG